MIIHFSTIDLFRVSGDLMSVLQDVIPEAISSQKYHVNTGPILNSYRNTGI